MSKEKRTVAVQMDIQAYNELVSIAKREERSVSGQVRFMLYEEMERYIRRESETWDSQRDEARDTKR